jgi:hypothetical protein
LIVFGTQLFGKVDKVPMLGHVATSFLYIQFVPLIPLGSYLVLEDGQGAVSVGFSFKSLMVAWLRAALVFGAIGLGIVGIISARDRSAAGIILGICGAVFCIAAMVGSYFIPFIGQASYYRAMDLAQRAGVRPEFRLTLEVHYGRKTAEQADAELAVIYEAEQKELAARQEELARMEAQRKSQLVNPFAHDSA